MTSWPLDAARRNGGKGGTGALSHLGREDRRWKDGLQVYSSIHSLIDSIVWEVD